MPVRGLKRLICLFGTALGVILSSQAHAQTCGAEYVLKEGENLSDIARVVYGSPSQWTIIFYANQDRLGTNASLLVSGASIRIPCVGNAKVASTPAAVSIAAPSVSPAFELSPMLKRIEFLTADNFSPYTDRTLPEGGLTTNIVTAAMALVKAQASGNFDFNIGWVNDWSAHLNPLLSTKAFDAGFP